LARSLQSPKSIYGPLPSRQALQQSARLAEIFDDIRRHTLVEGLWRVEELRQPRQVIPRPGGYIATIVGIVGLAIDPQLPADWRRLGFRVQWRDCVRVGCELIPHRLAEIDVRRSFVIGHLGAVPDQGAPFGFRIVRNRCTSFRLFYPS
jgi:hypothetical protein